jgi:hypothetical protein
MTDDNVGLRLQGEFDAMVWTEEFQRVVVDGGIEIDKNLMLGWFANAIMAGYDYAQKHPEEIGSTVVVSPTALDDLAGGHRMHELTPNPFTFTYADDGHLTLESAIYQALGYASVCWSETPTGIFDSDRCKEAGDALIAFVEDMT